MIPVRTRAARRGVPRPLTPSHTTPDPRAVERLIEEAARAARRLRPVCADWPEARFADLVYGAALVRLGALRPQTTSRVEGECPPPAATTE